MKVRILDICKAVMVGGLAASPAAALNCTFTKECFESEACSDTSFALEISDEGGAAKLVSDAETISVSLGGSDAVRVYVGVTDSAFHLLSRTPAGDARYTNHLYDGPMVVSYLGTCEDDT